MFLKKAIENEYHLWSWNFIFVHFENYYGHNEKTFFSKKKLDLEEGKKGVLVFKIRGIHIGANTAKTNTESIYEWKDKILMTSHSQMSKVSETSS